MIKQEKNDVTARHLATAAIKVMHVTRLKLYHGNKGIGRQIAEVNVDQYRVTRILAWNRVPTERRSVCSTLTGIFYGRNGAETWTNAKHSGNSYACSNRFMYCSFPSVWQGNIRQK